MFKYTLRRQVAKLNKSLNCVKCFLVELWFFSFLEGQKNAIVSDVDPVENPGQIFSFCLLNFQDQAQHISQVKAKSRGGSNCGSMADFSTEIVDNLEGLRDPAVGGNLGFWYICML